MPKMYSWGNRKNTIQLFATQNSWQQFCQDVRHTYGIFLQYSPVVYLSVCLCLSNFWMKCEVGSSNFVPFPFSWEPNKKRRRDEEEDGVGGGGKRKEEGRKMGRRKRKEGKVHFLWICDGFSFLPSWINRIRQQSSPREFRPAFVC